MSNEQIVAYQINHKNPIGAPEIPQVEPLEPASYDCKAKKKCCKKFKRGKRCGSCPKMKMMIALMEKAHFQC